MIRYTLECRNGHSQGVWPHHPPSLEIQRENGTCDRCGLSMRLKAVEFSAPYVRGDVPAHFNTSLGEYVSSGKHLRALQKAKGCSDFEKDSRIDARRSSALRDAKDGMRAKVRDRIENLKLTHTMPRFRRRHGESRISSADIQRGGEQALAKLEP